MRDYLRRETRAIHDRLDVMAANMPLAGDAEYASFLRAQGEVRTVLDNAFTFHPPLGLPAPPRQTMLIEADLDELNAPGLTCGPAVSFANGYEALGAAWVVSGSSLGNRAMLAQRRRSGLDRAHAFFSDPAMPEYFKRVASALETPFTDPECEQICKGAHLAFGLFEHNLAVVRQDCAA